MKKFICIILSVLFINCSVFAASKVSDWAMNDVTDAISIGIVPQKLKYDYQTNITRENVCEIAYLTVKNLYNGDIENLYKYDVSFDDTTNQSVLSCAKMGIVSGTSDNLFEPDLLITREQAAIILYNTLAVSSDLSQYTADTDNGISPYYLPHNFKDSSSIHNWARDEVFFMYHIGIMLGNSQNEYQPLDNYTVEQAICNFYRICNLSGNSITNAELYPDTDTALKINDDGSLDAIYKWYDKKYTFSPTYYDGIGNKYTVEQKGYVYPIEKNYMTVQTEGSADVSNYILIDKSGNEVESGHKYIYLYDNDKCCFKDDDGYTLYDLKTKEEFGTYPVFQYAGDDMYMYVENGFVGYCNSEFQKIIPAQYIPTGSKYAGGKTIIQKSDRSFLLIDSGGRILKSFAIDTEKYQLDSITGVNMVLREEDGKFCIYNAETEAFSNKYDYINLNSNGNSLVMVGGKYYMLNEKEDILFDADKNGFSQIDYYEKGDFYQAYSVDKQNYSKITPYSIIDKNGNVIMQNVSSFQLLSDGYGLNGYKSDDNTVVLFDNYGDELGSIVSDYKVINFKFVNGLVLLDTDNGNFYYTPSGKPALLNSK